MTNKNVKYYILHKPYGVLSQFTDKLGRKTLASIVNIPNDVYSVGRLDMDSEGLLLLSNNKKIVDQLLNPNNHHEKEYLVQVEGIPTEEEMLLFKKGLIIEKQKTLPAKIEVVNSPAFPDRVPPIRYRKNIPVCWLKIVLTEGRNRQVRKMTAAIGHPTLRLIRTRIKNINLGKLKSGEIRELSAIEVKNLEN